MTNTANMANNGDKLPKTNMPFGPSTTLTTTKRPRNPDRRLPWQQYPAGYSFYSSKTAGIRSTPVLGRVCSRLAGCYVSDHWLTRMENVCLSGRAPALRSCGTRQESGSSYVCPLEVASSGLVAETVAALSSAEVLEPLTSFDDESIILWYETNH
jgi:hypothetical protein